MTGVQTCALRSEEHTSELQSHDNLVCRLLLEKNRVVKSPRRGGTTHTRPPTPTHSPHGARRSIGTACALARAIGTSAGGPRAFIFFLNNAGPPKFTPFPLPPPLQS